MCPGAASQRNVRAGTGTTDPVLTACSKSNIVCCQQASFNVTTCKVCGLMYAPGEPSDEKTHAAFHTSALRGIKYAVRPASNIADGFTTKTASSAHSLICCGCTGLA